MTRSPHGRQQHESVRHAAELMAKHNIGAVLVYEGQELAGIVTDRDLVLRFPANGAVPENEPVLAVMTAHQSQLGPRPAQTMRSS